MKRPPLPKLWPERFTELSTLDHFFEGLSPLPKWHEIVREGKKFGLDPTDVEQFLSIPSCMPYFAMMRHLGKIAANRVFPRLSPEWYQEVTRMFTVETLTHYSTLRWEAGGKKVYVLDQELFELLNTTPLPEIPGNRLITPNKVFYLKLPAGAHFSVGIDDLQPLEGVVVVVQKDQITFLCCGKSPRDAGDDNIAYLTFPLSERTLDTLYAPPEDVDYPWIPIGEGRRECGVMVPHVVLNFCLYMMTEQPLLEPVPPHPRVEKGLDNLGPGKRKREERRHAKYSHLGYTWVGQKADRRVFGGGKGTGQKLEMPVPVRSHWRHQACGPRWQDHKLILVEEHWRGIAFLDENEEKPLRASRVQHAKRKEV